MISVYANLFLANGKKWNIKSEIFHIYQIAERMNRFGQTLFMQMANWKKIEKIFFLKIILHLLFILREYILRVVTTIEINCLILSPLKWTKIEYQNSVKWESLARELDYHKI